MPSEPAVNLEFLTERFELRPMREEDASPIFSGWTLDPVAAEMLNTEEREWTVQAQKQFFRTHARGTPKWVLAIIVRETREIIGIYMISTKPQDMVFTTTVLIGAKAWRGTRAASEIGHAVYKYHFNELGYAKAKINVRPQNKAMLWLLLQDGGWKREAVLNGHLYDRRTRQRDDLHVYGMLAEEWRKSTFAATTSFPSQRR